MSERKIAALILTHGRADNVVTYKTLKESGWSGDIVFVIDTEDEQADRYRKNYPNDTVFVFDKLEESKKFDTADLPDAKRNAIVYARNASFWIAEKLGYTHFIQLDDDYTSLEFSGEYDEQIPYKPIKNFQAVVSLMCDFLDSTNIKTICMAQGGDWIGGRNIKNKNSIIKKRKAMNSFVCRVDRPFKFIGRINEDVNTYTYGARLGDIFLTTPEISLTQKQTQSNSGGMTDIYQAQGTYVKSFYSVIFSPASVKIGIIKDTNSRIHHSIDWSCTVPKIIRQELKK